MSMTSSYLHVPSQQRLGRRGHLIVMRSIGKGGTILNEVVDPRCPERVGQVNIPSLDQRNGGGSARHLPPSGFTSGWPCPR
jgi:hypothetical protein